MRAREEAAASRWQSKQETHAHLAAPIPHLSFNYRLSCGVSTEEDQQPSWESVAGDSDRLWHLTSSILSTAQLFWMEESLCRPITGYGPPNRNTNTDANALYSLLTCICYMAGCEEGCISLFRSVMFIVLWWHDVTVYLCLCFHEVHVHWQNAGHSVALC